MKLKFQWHDSFTNKLDSLAILQKKKKKLFNGTHLFSLFEKKISYL